MSKLFLSLLALAILVVAGSTPALAQNPPPEEAWKPAGFHIESITRGVDGNDDLMQVDFEWTDPADTNPPTITGYAIEERFLDDEGRYSAPYHREFNNEGHAHDLVLDGTALYTFRLRAEFDLNDGTGERWSNWTSSIDHRCVPYDTRKLELSVNLSADAQTSPTISGSGYYRDGCGAQNAVQSYRIVRYIGDRDDVLYPPEREVTEVAGVEETVDGVDLSTFSLTDDHDFVRDQIRDDPSTQNTDESDAIGRTYHYLVSVLGTEECAGPMVDSDSDPCQKTITFNAADDAPLAPMTVASMRSKSRASGVRLWWGPKTVATNPENPDEFLIYRQTQMTHEEGEVSRSGRIIPHPEALNGEWEQIRGPDWCNVRLGGAGFHFCVDKRVEQDTLYLYRILAVKNGVNSKQVSKQVFHLLPAPSSN